MLLALLSWITLAEFSHAGPVTDLAFADRTMYSCSQAGVVVDRRDAERWIVRPSFRAIAIRPNRTGETTRLWVAGGVPGESGELAVYSISKDESPKLIEEIKIGSDLVYALEVSRDGRRVFAGLADGRVLSIGASDLSNRQALHKHTAPVRDLCTSPDGRFIASAGVDGVVAIHTLTSTEKTTAKPLLLTEHTSSVEAVVFSPDSKQLASASRDGKVRLHSVEGRFLRTYSISRRPIRALVWAKGERGLRAAGASGELFTLALSSDVDVLARLPVDGPVHSLTRIEGNRFVAGIGSRVHVVSDSPTKPRE